LSRAIATRTRRNGAPNPNPYRSQGPRVFYDF
jgi:hypothetical protein